MPDVCNNNDVINTHHYDDVDHEYCDVLGNNYDVDNDNIDDNDQNYQNKRRKLSDEGNGIKIDKLEHSKKQAKLEYKECSDEIQEVEMDL